MHLGRERPRKNRPRAVIGGVAEGVAHAPDASFTVADGRAHSDNGRHTAPPADTEPNLQIAKEMAESVDPAALERMWRRTRRSTGRGEGKTAPGSVFPPLF
jgi:hypothetical protein